MKKKTTKTKKSIAAKSRENQGNGHEKTKKNPCGSGRPKTIKYKLSPMCIRMKSTLVTAVSEKVAKQKEAAKLKDLPDVSHRTVAEKLFGDWVKVG